MEDLPTELCLKVFSYLDLKDLLSCAGTCRRLGEILEYSQLYRVLDFSPWGTNSYCQGITMSQSLMFKIFRRAKRNAITISLNGCTSFVNDSILLGVTRHCKCVKEIDLTDCTQVSDEGLGKLTSVCYGIEKIVMRNCSGLTSEGLKGPLMSLPNLTFLSLSRMFQLDEEVIGAVVGSCCPNLKFINTCRVDLSDLSILKIAKGCPRLEGVHFSYNERITHLGIQHLVAYLPRIMYMALRRCKHINNLAVKYIGNYNNKSGFRNLRHLDISYCSTNIDDEGILPLAEGCSSLEYIDISGLINVSAMSMNTLLKNCPDLAHLDVAGVSKLGDAFVEGVWGSSKLRYLDLANCWKIKTSSALKGLGVNCKYLSWLSLRNCVGVCDEAVVQFLKECKTIKSLNLSGCKKLTDAVLYAVLNRGNGVDNQHLDVLDVSMCKKMKGKPFLECEGFKGFEGIRDLDMRNCEEMSLDALKCLFSNLTFLQKVDISGIGEVNEELKGRCLFSLEVNFAYFLSSC